MKNAFEIQRPNGEATKDFRHARPSIARFGLYSFGINALIIGAGGALLFYLSFLDPRSDTTVATRIDHISVYTAYTVKVTSLVQHYGATLDRWCRDPRLVRAMEDGDETALTALRQSIETSLPSVLRVQFFPPNLRNMAVREDSSVSFAALDLLRRALRRGVSPDAEAHLFSSPQQSFNLVRAVVRRDNDKPAGLILASFPVELLEHNLRQVPLLHGYAELQQSSQEGAPLVLARGGNPKLRRGQPEYRSKIPDTRWLLAYWPRRDTAPVESNEASFFWGALGAVILLLGLANFRLFSGLTSALRNDQIAVLNLVEDMVNGVLRKNYPVTLANCQGTIEILTGIAQEYATMQHAKGGHARRFVDPDDPFEGELFPTEEPESDDSANGSDSHEKNHPRTAL